MTTSEKSFNNIHELWIKVTNELWDLVEKEPALGPVIYSWTIGKVTKFQQQSQSQNIDEASKPSLKIARLKIEVRKFREWVPSIWQRRPNEKCDVLFVPNSTRTNCLGLCITTADSVFNEYPNNRIGFISPKDMSESLKKPHYQKQYFFYNYNKGYLIRPWLMVKSLLLFRQIRKRVRTDFQLFNLFNEGNGINLWRKINSSISSVYYARNFLKGMGCRLLITPTEQWPPGSVFVAAAKLEGIRSCQILHGLPSRLYWPFLSDETWVWGPKTKHMFQDYGAPSSKLKVIGALEFVDDNSGRMNVHETGRPAIHVSKERSEGEFKDCLFLSQWHGIGSQFNSIYEEVLGCIGDAINASTSKWRLVIRMHPNDNEQIRNGYEEFFSRYKIGVGFSKKDVALKDDILHSNFACTMSSSSILMALMLRKPCGLVLPEEYENKLSEPVLDSSFIVTNSMELGAKLDETPSKDDFDRNIKNVLGDPDETCLRASKRIRSILMKGKRSAWDVYD